MNFTSRLVPFAALCAGACLSCSGCNKNTTQQPKPDRAIIAESAAALRLTAVRPAQ